MDTANLNSLNQFHTPVPNSFCSPPVRKWVRTNYGQHFRYDHHRGQSFVLMSYNILAQSLLTKHSYLYRHHRSEFLDWSHRLKCIKNKILEIKPDILCLQEAQQNHLKDIEIVLQPLNYMKPLYKKRSGDEYDDGCAIFYNSQRFELLAYHYVEYFQPSVKVLDRFNVAIIAKFALKRFKNLEILVATTHLLYNPRRDDIRTAQLQVLLAELDRMSFNTKTQEPLPIILTGDFNCLPFSTPFRLISDGYIVNSDNLPLSLGILDDCQHVSVTIHQNRDNTALFNSTVPVKSDSDCTNVITTENLQEHGAPYNTGAIWHYLNFSPTLISNKMASTHQDKWIMVDYIFYTKYTRKQLGPLSARSTFSPLKLIANYELPTKNDCQNIIGPIPNKIYGSDHFAMASEFVLLN